MCEENTCSEIRTLDFSGFDFTSQLSEHGVLPENNRYCGGFNLAFLTILPHL